MSEEYFEFDDEEQGEDVDWECPYDEIRSSEVQNITVKFLDNGKKVTKMDDKEQPYTQYRFRVIKLDMTNPKEITYTTSSKRLIDEIALEAPIKDKSFEIIKTGTGFQTSYKLKDFKK